MWRPLQPRCCHHQRSRRSRSRSPHGTRTKTRGQYFCLELSNPRTLEVISLIPDSEGDDDFPSPPTRKGKERARTQPRFPPTFPLVQSWTMMAALNFPPARERSERKLSPSHPIAVKDDNDEEELPLGRHPETGESPQPSRCLILEKANDCSCIQLWWLLLLPPCIVIFIVPPSPFLISWNRPCAPQ